MNSNIINFIKSLLGYCIIMPILMLSVMYVVESYVNSFYEEGDKDGKTEA